MRVVNLDGTWLGDHLMLVVLGISVRGDRHVLGVREGSTENEAVCRSLLCELIDRGLPVESAVVRDRLWQRDPPAQAPRPPKAVTHPESPPRASSSRRRV